MILLLADGIVYRKKIQDLLDTTAPTIVRWKRRFLQHPDRLSDGVSCIPASSRRCGPRSCRRRCCLRLKKRPKDGSTHWSCRKLASKLHVSKDTIQKGFWHKADVRPHPMASERYMASDDPDFALAKAADVIGLYLVSAAARGRVLAWMRRRRFSCVGPSRSGASLITGTVGAARLRISTQRYFVAVCGAGCEATGKVQEQDCARAPHQRGSSSASSNRSSLAVNRIRRFISFSTICRHTRPTRSKTSSLETAT